MRKKISSAASLLVNMSLELTSPSLLTRRVSI